ncbi:hypothetical protein C5S31_05285 [ANME-1 cluster archaeon GoMg2]|nr:hypothetical protein [ANME-1 cluster archaeon GoMg2]
MLAVFALTTTASAQEVYLLPQESTAAYSSTAEVEIWVDATNIQGGQINLTYNPKCADVTDWTRNTTNFPMGGREHYAGKDWITFTALDSLSGEYMVGRLTVRCVKEQEEDGETVLAFAEPSELFDAKGNPVAVDWRAGTFKCSGSTRQTKTQSSASGGGSGAMKTETPTATPLSTVTSGMTAAALPASTITPTQAATPSPTVSAFVSPTPTQSPEAKKELPDFEAVFAMLGLLVVQYLKSRRRK